MSILLCEWMLTHPSLLPACFSCPAALFAASGVLRRLVCGRCGERLIVRPGLARLGSHARCTLRGGAFCSSSFVLDCSHQRCCLTPCRHRCALCRRRRCCCSFAPRSQPGRSSRWSEREPTQCACGAGEHTAACATASSSSRVVTGATAHSLIFLCCSAFLLLFVDCCQMFNRSLPPDSFVRCAEITSCANLIDALRSAYVAPAASASAAATSTAAAAAAPSPSPATAAPSLPPGTRLTVELQNGELKRIQMACSRIRQ